MKKTFILTLLCAVLSACSLFSDDEKDPPLKGERISVMQLQKDLEPEKGQVAALDPITLPDIFENAFWPQAGGYPNHALQHVGFGADIPRKIWSTSIGEGANEGLPLVSVPVIADGLVFTLDTSTNVRAFTLSKGKRLWSENLRPKEEDEEVVGGGLAYSEGVLYVTTGFANVIALDAKTGQEIWAVALQAPARAAPTIHKGMAYIATLDNKVVALNAADGAIIWDYQGIGETAGLLGAAAPAASDDAVIAAFSSGEIFALRPSNGSVIWGDNLAPPLRVGGVAGLSDIRALPVLDQGLVIGMSYAGRIAAIEAQGGQRVWQRDFGGAETPWISGNTIYVLTKENQFLALARDSGIIRWITQLEKLKDSSDKSTPQIWLGPILAGGRLIVVAQSGLIAEYNPLDGTFIRTTKIGKTIALTPVIAEKTLVLLAADGTLLAYQ